MVLEGLSQEIISLIQNYGIIAVVVAAVIEEIIVPIPSPVIPMAAGAILVQAGDPISAFVWIFFFIAIPASIGSVISSYFVYGIVFYGGRPAVDRYGRFLDFSWDELKHLEQRFAGENEEYYVALFRALPVVPLSVVSGTAGLFRMDWKSYGVWSLLGMLPRNTVLAFLGWYFGDRFLSVAGSIDSFSTLTLLIIAVLIGGYLIYRFVDSRVRSKLLKVE